MFKAVIVEDTKAGFGPAGQAYAEGGVTHDGAPAHDGDGARPGEGDEGHGGHGARPGNGDEGHGGHGARPVDGDEGHGGDGAGSGDGDAGRGGDGDQPGDGDEGRGRRGKQRCKAGTDSAVSCFHQALWDAAVELSQNVVVINFLYCCRLLPGTVPESLSDRLGFDVPTTRVALALEDSVQWHVADSAAGEAAEDEPHTLRYLPADNGDEGEVPFAAWDVVGATVNLFDPTDIPGIGGRALAFTMS